MVSLRRFVVSSKAATHWDAGKRWVKEQVDDPLRNTLWRRVITHRGPSRHPKLLKERDDFMDSLKDAFEDLIKDIHSAEKQIEKALPKVIKKCTDETLRKSFEQHLEETENQTKMVEEIAKICGFKPTGKVCHGMVGIIEEAAEHLGEEPSALLDANLIAAAQKVEHYEICNYGTAVAWAEQLKLKEVIPMLEQIKQEEEATDQKLNELALTRVNKMAAQMPESEEKKAAASKSKSPQSKVSVR
jgi:ferritin-like metal-binding protein YciE